MSEALEELSQQYLSALAAIRVSRFDEAEELLRKILAVEPRLPEPHLSLGRLLLDTDRLEDSEAHTREGLEHLQNSGPWTDDLDSNTVEAMAHAQLAETLRRLADEDDILFGDPAVFQKLINDARTHFSKAAELDPSDEYASFHAFFLGPKPAKDGEQ